jgi:hypothetical protein
MRHWLPNAKKSMHFIFRFEVKGVVLFVIGIHGNTVVDKEANDALEAPIYNCSIPFTDCKNSDKTAGSSKFIANFTKYI